MADHSMEQKFIKMNYRAAIVFTCAFLLIITFFLAGGWASARDSVANVRWLKRIASNGIDQQLLFPLGVCGDGQALSKEGERNAPQPASPYLAGLAALRIGDLLNAEQLLQRAMDEGISPNSSPYALGVVYYLEGKEAVKIWRQTTISLQSIITGNDCAAAGSIEFAAKYYKLALETIEPNNRKGYQHLAEFFAGTQDQEAFDTSFQGYITLADPNSLEYHRTLGNIYLAQKQYSQAVDQFQYVLRLSPNDSAIWYSGGKALIALKEYDQARIFFSKAIELDLNTLVLYLYMGDTYFYEQQYDEAGVWYAKALKIDPNNVSPIIHLVYVRLGQKRYSDALKLVINAVQLNRRADILALAAEVASKMENWELGLYYIDEAINMESEHISYYRQQGEICEALNDLLCMKNAYQDILRLDPSDINTQSKFDNLLVTPP